MNAYERAHRLFEKAEELGMDAPSESMVAEELMHAESDVWTEIAITLRQTDFKEAARAVERWDELRHAPKS